jgi:hypothetical protein
MNADRTKSMPLYDAVMNNVYVTQLDSKDWDRIDFAVPIFFAQEFEFPALSSDYEKACHQILSTSK